MSFGKSAFIVGLLGPVVGAPIAYFVLDLSWAWVFLPPVWWVGVGVAWAIAGVALGYTPDDY